MTNLEAVQGGLRIVRDALTPLIAKTLQSEYGEDWWQKGVLDALLADGKPITDRPEQGNAGDLDLQTALKIVQVYHWELFSDTMDWGGRQRTLLAAVIGVRNQYEGHVTPNREAELTDAKVRDIMGGMESFLLLFDRKAADQLGRLTERWKAPEPELIEDEEEPVILARKVLETHRSEPERVHVETLQEKRPASPPKTDPKPMHPIMGSRPAQPITGKGQTAAEPPKEEKHGFAPQIIREPQKKDEELLLPKVGDYAPRAAARRLSVSAASEPKEQLKSTNSVGRLPKDEENRQESAGPTAKRQIASAEGRDGQPRHAAEGAVRWSRTQPMEASAASRRLNPLAEEDKLRPPPMQKAQGEALDKPSCGAELREAEPQLYVPDVPRRTPRRQRQEPIEVHVAPAGKRRDIQARPVEEPRSERQHINPRALWRLIICGIAALILGVALFILDQYLG